MIKPCPFCHTVNTVILCENCTQMECLNCGARGPNGDNAEEAVILWNDRPNKPAK